MKASKKEFRIKLGQKFDFDTDWKWFKNEKQAIDYANIKYGEKNIVSISNQTGNIFSGLNN